LEARAVAQIPERTTSGDGRVLRGERNREQIVSAILELIREGDRTPTADSVARRAKVGPRTLFRHFEDMESLYAAVLSRIQEDVLPLMHDVSFEGSTDDRIRSFARCRARAFEHLLPFHRSTDPESRSPVIQDGLANFEALLRGQLEEAFASELASVESDRVEALVAATSVEVWDRLRSTQGLGRERAVRVLQRMVAALLAAERRI
jgi:AcrR family transcriptional regulator